MTTHSRSRLKSAWIPCILTGALLATASTAATTEPVREPAPETLSMWNDPVFQKQFLGSYGFQAELEPRLTQIERQDLEKVMGLMASDVSAAAALLDTLAKPDASAIFDFTLGNIYFQQDKPEPAGERYARAVAKFPSFRRAHKNLGLIQVRTGQMEEAIKSLSRVIELGGSDGLTYGLLGYAYSQTEQFVSAESAYRTAVLLQPDLLDWKLGLTQSVLKQKKYGEAASLSEELLARHPDRADFWMIQANAFLGLGQPLKAAEDFEIVHRMGKETLQSLYTLGDIYANEGLFDMAARSYGQAVVKNADQPLDRPVRCVEILSQRSAVPQALALLAKVRETFAERLDDEEKKRLLKLDARLSAASGSSGGSVAVLEQIVALDPLDGEALMLLGQHYQRGLEPERALFYYERAASLGPFEADAKVRQAQVLVGQSKYREAVPLLKRAQELKPREDVARYLEQVERVARAK